MHLLFDEREGALQAWDQAQMGAGIRQENIRHWASCA